ncbi:MAG: hypothetical protein AAF944_27565 [Bacteroidota bacterium]
MPGRDRIYFQQLKQDIVQQVRQSHPQLGTDISAWKGQEIRLFQQDLEEKANGRISEKWFYTHIKSDQPQLPRIDILNLLSQYVGCTNWEDYRHQKTVSQGIFTQLSIKRKHLLLLSILLILIALMSWYSRFSPSTAYQFCFVNADTQQAVNGSALTVVILSENESPYRIPIDSIGCAEVYWRTSHIRLLVQGAYYRTDTITRILDKNQASEQISLKPNDYAWLLRIFSQADVDDWQKRRLQLDAMLTNDAQIYQLTERQTLGMALYNKQEFINKMTMPLRSLQNIEVLSTKFRGDQIQELRFKQVNDETNH